MPAPLPQAFCRVRSHGYGSAAAHPVHFHVPFATSILVPTDLSPASHAALFEAARIARETQARVTVLYVFDAGPFPLPPTVANPESLLRSMAEEANGAAQSVLLGLRDRYFPGLDVSLRTAENTSAAQAICALARELSADLIVLSSQGRTAAGGVGSVTEKVVRTADMRVLVVPSRDPAELAH
jgi:nucleotide-binding universal stress UspA family protein